MRSAILPLMFIVQRERGYLDPPGVAYLAKRLHLRITDIWEVATFYSMLNTTPVGKYHIQVCKTLSCKIMGEPGITEHVCQKLGIRPGETTADGRFTVSLVECLGSCGTAPMMQIGFDYHENLTTAKGRSDSGFVALKFDCLEAGIARRLNVESAGDSRL